jgi:PPK2 family polyphosphate:nucleotide phosphotransferase
VEHQAVGRSTPEEKRFHFDGKKKARLKGIDPSQKAGFKDRKEAERRTAEDVAAIDKLQDRLYAEGKQALLVVLQAMDAGGKDGTIRRIFGPVDPLGIRAVSFKRPSAEELAHDFLWRIHRQVPAKGEIVIFNRSHYEDVLVVRVHNLAPAKVIEQRYEQINRFERLLADNGVKIVKLFLHISSEEQRERLQERVDIAEKRWKFNPGDLEERKHWDSYMKAFEIAINRCSTPWAPWYVVPANRNWYRNAIVARIIRSAMEDMKPRYPAYTFDPSAIRVV